MKSHFLFKYQTLGENYQVIIDADNLNKAMLHFAKYYHKIGEVFSIKEI